MDNRISQDHLAPPPPQKAESGYTRLLALPPECWLLSDERGKPWLELPDGTVEEVVWGYPPHPDWPQLIARFREPYKHPALPPHLRLHKDLAWAATGAYVCWTSGLEDVQVLSACGHYVQRRKQLEDEESVQVWRTVHCWRCGGGGELGRGWGEVHFDPELRRFAFEWWKANGYPRYLPRVSDFRKMLRDAARVAPLRADEWKGGVLG